MVGQDGRGNWVVQDQSGTRGGLFVERLDALCYVRSQIANRSALYIAVSGVFELDMTNGDLDGTRRMRIGTSAHFRKFYSA